MAKPRGPVPKRSDERRRRNVPDSSIDRPEMVGEVEAPATPDDLHPVAADWFESLRISGQAQWYEPSDWMVAVYVAHEMSRALSQRLSAQMFAAVMSSMTELLTTEGARRRARMEVERQRDDDGEDAGVATIDDYRQRLSG